MRHSSLLAVMGAALALLSPARASARDVAVEGRKAVASMGGSYQPDGEVVLIGPFTGRADVTLEF